MFELREKSIKAHTDRSIFKHTLSYHITEETQLE